VPPLSPTKNRNGNGGTRKSGYGKRLKQTAKGNHGKIQKA
jgi:hypothetical protein